ncbi:hypothetical protein KSP39_PZI013665 [Platanthera zijinensis]|uniref:KANL3/Tex30 alpha/beta hydrolase-like domain-containing protein n=1 Tax=Platanthera zijinensis TaxID=2320716 RepID=A0AAP0BBI1_9ASPA
MESVTVDTADGVKLSARLFNPADLKSDHAVVLVHPFTVLGGFQGLLRGIASGLAERGFRAVTFDMRGARRSSGRPSLTGFPEIEDVIAVCRWVSDSLSPRGIILVGSSAGAPIAGSAVDKIEQVVGYVSLGYPFGWAASVLFGRHHEAILRSKKPKLFVMGTKDGFTSVKQLQNKLKSSTGRTETHLLDGVGHFQMEGPVYDALMVNLIVDFIQTLQPQVTWIED